MLKKSGWQVQYWKVYALRNLNSICPLLFAQYNDLIIQNLHYENSSSDWQINAIKTSKLPVTEDGLVISMIGCS